MDKLDWRFYPPNKCPCCHNETIEAYNFFNYGMNYQILVNAFMSSQPVPQAFLDKQEIYTFRCKRCGKNFPVKWLAGYPVPDIHSESMKEFMGMFKSCK